jgi:hypothetical protein
MTALQECAGESSPCHPATLFSYNDDDLNFQLKSLQGFNLASPFPSEGEANEVYRVRVGGDYDGDGTRETLITVSGGRQSGSFVSQFTADRWSQRITSAYSDSTALSGSEDRRSRKPTLTAVGRAVADRTAPSGHTNVAFAYVDYNLPRGAPANSDPFGKVSPPTLQCRTRHWRTQATGTRRGLPWRRQNRHPHDCNQLRLAASDGFGPRTRVFFLHINNISGLLSVGQHSHACHASAESLVVCLPRVTDIIPQGTYAQAAIDHVADFNGDGLADFYLKYDRLRCCPCGQRCRYCGVAIPNPVANAATINDMFTQLGLD